MPPQDFFAGLFTDLQYRHTATVVQVYLILKGYIQACTRCREDNLLTAHPHFDRIADSRRKKLQAMEVDGLHKTVGSSLLKHIGPLSAWRDREIDWFMRQCHTGDDLIRI